MYRGRIDNKSLAHEPEYKRLTYKHHEWEVPSDLWGCSGTDPRLEEWVDAEVRPSLHGEFFAGWGRRDADA